ncbi:hypothetical protein CPC08DRAFT_727603 [Agrocybe pediades]|nr:hypothetical protein CPC08DRAFT_727603 [Agrocybe pediades]
MSCVGLGRALGIQLEVPPLLSIAGPLFLCAASTDLPLEHSLDIVRLVTTPSEPMDPWRAVEVYSNACWHLKSPPADIFASIATSLSVNEMLHVHRAQLAALNRPRPAYAATVDLIKMIPDRPLNNCPSCQTNHSLARNCLSELASMYIISRDNVVYFHKKTRLMGAQLQSLVGSSVRAADSPAHELLDLNAQAEPGVEEIDLDAAWAEEHPVSPDNSARQNELAADNVDTEEEVDLDAAWAEEHPASPDNSAPQDEPSAHDVDAEEEIDLDAAWAEEHPESTDQGPEMANAGKQNEDAADDMDSDIDLDAAWADGHAGSTQDVAPADDKKVKEKIDFAAQAENEREIDRDATDSGSEEEVASQVVNTSADNTLNAPAFEDYNQQDDEDSDDSETGSYSSINLPRVQGPTFFNDIHFFNANVDVRDFDENVGTSEGSWEN